MSATSPFVQTVLVPWLTAFGMAFAPILASLAATFIIRAMHRRNLDTAWFEAISRAGGVAYASLLASGRPVTDRAALATAARAGAGYLADRVAPQVAARALTPEAVAQIAGAELGRLLAIDPTSAPGGASNVTATAGPGQVAAATVEPAAAAHP